MIEGKTDPYISILI